MVLYIDILIQSHKGIKIVSLFILPEAFVGVPPLSKLILLSGGFNFTNHLECRNTRKYWEDLPGSSYCILHWNKRHVLIAGGGTGHHQLFLVKFGVLEPAKSKWFRPKPEASYQSSIGKGFGHQTVKDLGLLGPFFVDDLPQRIIRLIKGPGSGPWLVTIFLPNNLDRWPWDASYMGILAI